MLAPGTRRCWRNKAATSSLCLLLPICVFQSIKLQHQCQQGGTSHTSMCPGTISPHHSPNPLKSLLPMCSWQTLCRSTAWPRVQAYSSLDQHSPHPCCMLTNAQMQDTCTEPQRSGKREPVSVQTPAFITDSGGTRHGQTWASTALPM